MSAPSGNSAAPESTAAQFVTTHWSAVLAAGRRDDTCPRHALTEICETYWYPLYHYARRRGYAAPDAQDLTQEFFARLLAGNWLGQADRERGRFRSFLLSAMKHFLTNEWHKKRARKRGGQAALLSFDTRNVEGRFQRETATEETPESLFERNWALALLETVLTRLEREYRQEGKADLFTALKTSLTMEGRALAYPALAAELGLTEGAARVAVCRLRKRYRQVLRAQVAQTVASPDEVEDELRHLFQVLAPKRS